MRADPVKAGDMVRWLNASSAADEAAEWEVQSVTAAGTYARITDRDRAYPNCQSFCVPVGRLVRADQYGTHSTFQPESPPPDESIAAPPPLHAQSRSPITHKGGLSKDDLPRGGPEVLYAWLQEQGANTLQLQQYKAVMDQKAPNGGVRTMRCRNWVLNHFNKEQ
jgi:hypothetical protein